MKEYRFHLDKGSRKFPCPECSKRRFVRYIDASTGEYLPEMYGKCDRADNCGYFHDPYRDGYAAGMDSKSTESIFGHGKFFSKEHFLRERQVPVDLQSIPIEVLKATKQGYEHNIFVKNLLERVPFPFSVEDVEQVVALYHLGTISSAFLKGAVTFPFIDTDHRVRAVQVKQFDQSNHTTATNKLDKMLLSDYKITRRPPPEWLTKYIAYGDSNGYFTCLFGEHLLKKFPNNPVALVEAPKTAIYGNLYFGIPESPEDLIWLAVYNKSSFSLEKMKVLKGRNILVFPDLSKDAKTYDEWHTKAKAIQAEVPGLRFTFSDLLERLAPDKARADGADLADFLIQLDWRQFRASTSNSEPLANLVEIPAAIGVKSEKCEAVTEEEKRTDHDQMEVANLDAPQLDRVIEVEHIVANHEVTDQRYSNEVHLQNDHLKLESLAQSILDKRDSATRAELLVKIKAHTSFDDETTLQILLKEGYIIKDEQVDAYYLSTSTPF